MAQKRRLHERKHPICHQRYKGWYLDALRPATEEQVAWALGHERKATTVPRQIRRLRNRWDERCALLAHFGVSEQRLEALAAITQIKEKATAELEEEDW